MTADKDGPRLPSAPSLLSAFRAAQPTPGNNRAFPAKSRSIACDGRTSTPVGRAGSPGPPSCRGMCAGPDAGPRPGSRSQRQAWGRGHGGVDPPSPGPPPQALLRPASAGARSFEALQGLGRSGLARGKHHERKLPSPGTLRIGTQLGRVCTASAARPRPKDGCSVNRRPTHLTGARSKRLSRASPLQWRSRTTRQTGGARRPTV